MQSTLIKLGNTLCATGRKRHLPNAVPVYWQSSASDCVSQTVISRLLHSRRSFNVDWLQTGIFDHAPSP